MVVRDGEITHHAIGSGGREAGRSGRECADSRWRRRARSRTWMSTWTLGEAQWEGASAVVNNQRRGARRCGHVNPADNRGASRGGRVGRRCAA